MRRWLLLPVIFTLTFAFQAWAEKYAERIGFMSGTFDPPHRGHEGVIRAAIKDLGLDVVYVIANFDPEDKPTASDFERRLELVRLAFKSIPQVIVVDEKTSRRVREQGIRKSLGELASQNAGKTIYHLMGSDSFDRFVRYGEKYPAGVELALMIRETGFKAPKEIQGTKVNLIKSPVMGLSSTLIRKLLSEGKDPGPEQLRPAVLKKLREFGLFTKPGMWRCVDLFSNAG